MEMGRLIEDLAAEAEGLIRDGAWVLTPRHRSIVAKAALDLHGAVGAPQAQEALPAIDRLEHLREALAALAITLARGHGRTAWCLGTATTALTPVLHWPAMPAEDSRAFGAVLPTPQQYAEAEDAVRRLQSALVASAWAPAPG